MVKVYFSSYSRKLSDSDFYGYLRLLPAALERKIMRLKKWEDQHASLYGKLLLIKALKDAGLNADLSHLKYTSYGRPYLEGAPDFNISHSGCFAVCALSLQGKIGVDIEEIKSAAIYEFKDVFSEEEWNGILASGNLDYWFYYYWTAKEAAIKGDGRGMELPLSEIKVQNNNTKIGEITWYIKRIIISNDYLLQIATDTAIEGEVSLSQEIF